MYKIKNKTSEEQIAYYTGNVIDKFKPNEEKTVEYRLAMNFKQPVFEVSEVTAKEIEKDSQESKEQKSNNEVKNGRS